MAKSLGNFFTVRDLLDKGYPGEVIRFVMLSTHYRKPMDWTERKAEEAEDELRDWFAVTDQVHADHSYDWWIADALADDLNTHLALTRLRQLKPQPARLKAGLGLLGFPNAEDVDWWRERELTLYTGPVAIGDENASEMMRRVKPFLQKWQELRDRKDYEAADALREQLRAIGLDVRATGSGPQAIRTSRFDPAKLETLK